jgi:hypothetical protein
MSRQSFGETIRTIGKEIKEFEWSDRILDLIAIVGAVLFIISFFSVYLGDNFNSINIFFILYPLAVSGLAAAFRTKILEKPEDKAKMFRDWLIIMGAITLLGVIVMIIAFAIA